MCSDAHSITLTFKLNYFYFIQTKIQLTDHTVMFDDKSKQLRWFVLPSEALACLQGSELTNSPLPFCPPSLRESLGLSPFEEKTVDGEINDSDKIENNYYHSQKHVTSQTKCTFRGDQSTLDSCDDKNTESTPKVKFSTGDSREKVCNIGGEPTEKSMCRTNSIGKTCSTSDKECNKVNETTADANISCDTNGADNITTGKDMRVDGSSRKRSGGDTDVTIESIVTNKKVKENQKRDTPSKKKQGLRWYSPPKSIFAPFLKVSYLSRIEM